MNMNRNQNLDTTVSYWAVLNSFKKFHQNPFITFLENILHKDRPSNTTPHQR